MQPLSLDRTHPNAFILVSEKTHPGFDPKKDQVWQLNLDSTAPQPFSLSTTYGLRAKSMRIFPNLIINNHRISKAADFSQFPKVTYYTPNSIELEANYRNLINFDFKCYLPEPNVLLGIIQLENQKSTPIDITLQLALNLVPMGRGQPSHPEKSGNNHFLTGNSANLEPVLFMTGGPTGISNPFPALSIQLEIIPNGTQEVLWCLVSEESMLDSLNKAKKFIASNWREGFQIRTMRSASQILRIKTGDPDWDAAFFLSQVNANTHFIGDKEDFIRTRLPDGSSFSGNKAISSELLSNLDLHHLCQVMLPIHQDQLQSILEKQAAKLVHKGQNTSNQTDFLALRSNKECPLLGTIVLEVFEFSQDIDFLKHVFPDLSQLFRSWVEGSSSENKNQPIVWENPEQLQIDTGLFSFEIWETYSKGLNIKKTESPALYAMLLKEAKALNKIAKLIGDRSQQRFYNQWQKELSKRLESCWDEEKGFYIYRDIETHLCPSREFYYPGYVKNRIDIDKNFIKPQRLQCHIYTSDEHTRASIVKIEGLNSQGEPLLEVFKPPNIIWVLGRAHITTDHLFASIKSISFDGCRPEDRFVIESADYAQQDISCLLPLWSDNGTLPHCQKLASEWIDPQDPAFLYGIPETWQSQHPLPEDLSIRVNVLWNTLIIEGLVNQGALEKATVLFSYLMKAVIRGLKDYDGFYGLYKVNNSHPAGQLNAIVGLVPIQLFLKIAGIKVFSPTRVALWGHNPFPWPIEIHWRGLSLLKEGDQTAITFPNGASTQHISEKPVILTSDLD